MAGCIHPACNCEAYHEPKRVKGTLLQLRMGCQVCNHHASDHRQLTAVDKLIEREVTAAAGNKCTHLIPVTEISLSPVFGPHDLIPMPFDDAPDKECGVPCACGGFQVTAIVRLWQKFRTYSMNDVLLAVPQITCSFCQHPLLNHQEVTENNKSLVVTTFEKGVSNLTLKSAAKVDIALVSGSCVQFIPPKDTKGNLMFVALTESGPTGSSLELRVHSQPLCLQEKQDGREREKVKEKEGKSGEMANEENPAAKKSDDHSTEQLCTHKSASTAISTTMSEGQNLRITRQPPPQSAVVDPIVDGKVSNSVAGEKTKSVGSPKKRGRKRKQTIAMSTGLRKSARIAAKTAVVPSESQSLNVSFQLKDISLGRVGLQDGSMNGMPAALDRQKAVEELALRENVAMFVESLKKKESFTPYRLPEAIPTADLEVMAATGCCLDPTTGKSTLLVALGGGAGEVYVWTPVNGLQLTPLEPTCTVQSLSWQELLSPASSEAVTGTYLCIGGSRGTLHIWQVQLQSDSQRIQCQLYPIEGKVDVPTRADIVACSWAPNGKFLAVGSLMGEVLVYTFPSCEHIQTLHCCRAPVTCFAWSTDCSMLAVGGSDDCVQVLQHSSPPSVQTHPRNSILKYMKVDPKSRKYIHTHSLIGHQSFVGNLAFLSSGTSTNTLVSIGWDSQILFWQIQSSHDSLTNTRSRGHSRSHPNLPFVDTEPQCGYKVGPSASVEFLPIALHTVPGSGLVVMLMDKLGAVTIANYHFTL